MLPLPLPLPLAAIAIALALSLSLCPSVHGKVYLKEQFKDGWKGRWVESTSWKSAEDMGPWKWTAGKWYGDASDKGIQTGEDARFYGISAPLTEEFTNEGTDLVVQFSVKHEQEIDCGGAYIKLLGDIDQASFGGETPYQIMFGPDICGYDNRKTHVIFHYPPKNENLLVKDDVKVETDQLSHLYTLHVKSDSTYEVFIDEVSVRSGKLEEDWDFLPPKEIADPDQSKPLDWVDEKRIPDPSDTKPEGYDDIPREIPDPAAIKPDDWDDEEDGEWEPPLIDNPEYKGEWKPKMIANPDYIGEWVHPLIPNPEYFEDPKLYVRCNKCKYVGFELWQVLSGTLFDDIFVSDSLEEAKAFAKETYWKKKDAEKKMFDDIQEEKREKERKEREEADKKRKEDSDEDDDEDERDEL